MCLNKHKSKFMLINFTRNHQFSTKIELDTGNYWMQIVRGDHTKLFIIQKEHSIHHQKSLCKNDYRWKTLWIQFAYRRDDQYLHIIHKVCCWAILCSLAFISKRRRAYSPREGAEGSPTDNPRFTVHRLYLSPNLN